MSSPRLPWFAATFVSLASTAVGGFFGVFAGMFFYDHSRPQWALGADNTGLLLGAILGLGVGLAWVAWMRRPRQWTSRGWLVGRGVGGGVLAGAACTLVLHLLLQLAFGWGDAVQKHMYSQIIAIIPASLLGLIGGILWAAGSPRAWPEDDRAP